MMLDAPERMNDSGTRTPIDTGLTQTRSGFDPLDTRRQLIAKRVAAGANSPDGHTCSNLVEQLQEIQTYVRPTWAQDERQTLSWLIKQQMKRLAPRSAALPAPPKMLTYQPEGV